MKKSKGSKKQWKIDGAPAPNGIKFTPPEEDIVRKIARKEAAKACKKMARKTVRKFQKRLKSADDKMFTDLVAQINSDVGKLINNVLSLHMKKFHASGEVVGTNEEPNESGATNKEPKSMGPQGMVPDILIPTPDGDIYVSELRPGCRIYGARGKHLVINKTGGYEAAEPSGKKLKSELSQESDVDPLYPRDARTVTWMPMTIKDIMGYASRVRISRDTIPEQLNVWEIAVNEDKEDNGCIYAPIVETDFWGTFITDSDLPVDESNQGCFDISSDEWDIYENSELALQDIIDIMSYEDV